MIPNIINVFILLATPFLVIKGGHKLLFFIALWSILTEFMMINLFGYKFYAAAYIGLFYFIFNSNTFFSTPSPLGKYFWFEIILISIVGFYFVLFAPWEDPYASFRKETQKLPLRTVVGIIRTAETLIIYFYFLFIFKTGLIKFENFVNLLIISLIIFLIIGGLDTYILSGRIRVLLMPGHYTLDRFTGLQGEPRGIGQLGVVAIFIFLPLLKYYKENLKKKIYILISIACSLLYIALSQSSTAVGYGMLCFIIYILWGKLQFRQVILSLIIMLGIGYILLNSEEYVLHQQQRLAKVALESQIDQIDNVPDIINSLEVFDQAAGAFMYLNPIYSIFGVGPNTVNIPATNYMAASAGFDSLDTSPANGIVYIITRVGFIGFFYFIFIFFKTNKLIKTSSNPYLLEIFSIIFIYNLLYRNLLFWVISGIIIGVVLFEKQSKETI